MENQNRFQDFIKNIGEKISNLTTLEIKTIVGDYVVDGKDQVAPRSDAEFKVIFSKIDLIDGDMTTHFSTEMLNDRYEWLRNFHASKEARGHEIIAENINAVKSLIELYKSQAG
ncbi:MAG: hypothetical protein EAZ57_05240 [Cytophagales bacterium]|nr:MAG: hypothetical protein EAZ67_06340 [Cytophagales bacterium]TAF60955.1 MAG: hypothetical protein EAZ57_05240 [Cytophagales bacterium]